MTLNEMASAALNNLVAVREQVVRVEKQLRQHGLTLVDYGVLTMSGERVGDITATLVFSHGNATHHCEKLERKGFITRERSTEDRRVVNIHRTPTGDALIASLSTHIIPELVVVEQPMPDDQDNAAA